MCLQGDNAKTRGDKQKYTFAKIDRKFEKRSVILAFVPTINLIISTHY